MRRTPDYGAVRLAASIEAHPDVKQQRSDARRYAVEVLRIVARTLQSGEMQHLRLNVPADPITASVLGASLYRIAYEIEEHGQRNRNLRPTPDGGDRAGERRQTNGHGRDTTRMAAVPLPPRRVPHRARGADGFVTIDDGTSGETCEYLVN